MSNQNVLHFIVKSKAGKVLGLMKLETHLHNPYTNAQPAMPLARSALFPNSKVYAAYIVHWRIFALCILQDPMSAPSTIGLPNS